MEVAKSLVLVVGAGASKEANLPVGDELKRYIAQLLDIRFGNGHEQSSGDRLIMEALRKLASADPQRDVNPMLHECRHISRAMPQAISIDNFIESHRANPQITVIGKIAIAKAILDAEAKSLLKFDSDRAEQTIAFSHVADTWYNRLFSHLSEGCDLAEFSAKLSRIAIVCFNYDRCIEHFLYHGIQNFYRVSAADAALAMQRLEIFHTYGSAGTLPWMQQGGSMQFGATPSGGELVQLSRELQTFTEGTDPARSDISRIRTVVHAAERLVFLGFAFHPLNLDLILPNDPPSRAVTGSPIYGTAHGISQSDSEVIVADLARRFDTPAGRIALRRDLVCVSLFDEYRRTLAIR